MNELPLAVTVSEPVLTERGVLQSVPMLPLVDVRLADVVPVIAPVPEIPVADRDTMSPLTGPVTVSETEPL